jgi:hypothetical protein
MRRSRKPLRAVRSVEGSNPSPSAQIEPKPAQLRGFSSYPRTYFPAFCSPLKTVQALWLLARTSRRFEPNERTLVGRTTQNIATTLLPDGSFTVSFVGTDFRLPVPGAGISFGSVGRFLLVFDTNNTLIDVRQDVGNARGDFAVICSALKNLAGVLV